MASCCSTTSLQKAASSTSGSGWIRFRFVEKWLTHKWHRMACQKGSIYFIVCFVPLRRIQRMRKSPCVLLETRWTSGSNSQREAVWAVCMERSWLRCVTFHSTWWKSVYTDAWPPRHLNKRTALSYVNTFLTGIRRLVLRNKCQRRNQCRWGCASSCEVGGHRDRKRGLECKVFFLHNPWQHSACFSIFHREVKKNVKLRRQSDSQVRLSPTNPKKTLNNCCGLSQ